MLQSRRRSGGACGRWSAAEDRYLGEHWEEPAREVALALGRTLWGVRARRTALWQGRGHDEA